MPHNDLRKVTESKGAVRLNAEGAGHLQRMGCNGLTIREQLLVTNVS